MAQADDARALVLLQGKALAAASVMCAGLGVLAVGAWKLAGMQYKEIAEVSSWHDAIALAKSQRVRPARPVLYACPVQAGSIACAAGSRRQSVHCVCYPLSTSAYAKVKSACLRGNVPAAGRRAARVPQAAVPPRSTGH
jgi:hypothetical protein